MSEPVNFFKSNFEAQSGIITHLLTKGQNLPKFSINENPTAIHQADPTKMYENNPAVLSFNTQSNDPAFLEIDFYPFKVHPMAYSINLFEGYTPPVLWNVDGRNFETEEWLSISSPGLLPDICTNGTTSRNLCGDTVVKPFPCTSTNSSSFRFIRFRILQSRIQLYFSSDYVYFRIGKFDIYGYLHGETMCISSKPSISLLNIFSISCVIALC